MTLPVMTVPRTFGPPGGQRDFWGCDVSSVASIGRPGAPPGRPVWAPATSLRAARVASCASMPDELAW